MDKSTEYIKMCSKATEIQDELKVERGFKYGDIIVEYRRWNEINWLVLEGKPYEKEGKFYTGDYNFRLFNIEENKVYDNYKIAHQNVIILPLQDQLQEMTIEKQNWRKATKDLITLSNNMTAYHYKYPELFTSMEQLWLAYIMKELYNKKWNGEEWEKV